jgi:hypothetical protein
MNLCKSQKRTINLATAQIQDVWNFIVNVSKTIDIAEVTVDALAAITQWSTNKRGYRLKNRFLWGIRLLSDPR